MQRLLAVTLLALALLVPPGAAAEATVATGVLDGDADAGLELQTTTFASVGFLDDNNNGRLDLARPDEPVYLDLDNSRTANYGDLRLLGFHNYPAGSVVDVANRDAGRTLVPASGWFARDGATWYFDTDGSLTVTAADLRLQGTPAKVAPGDAALTRPLSAAAGSRGAVGWADADGDRRHGADERLYVDGDAGAGARKASAGDLRIAPQGLGRDLEATQADLARALATTATGGPLAADAPDGPADPKGWRTLDWILVVVGVANLSGLIVVGRLATMRPK